MFGNFFSNGEKGREKIADEGLTEEEIDAYHKMREVSKVLKVGDRVEIVSGIWLDHGKPVLGEVIEIERPEHEVCAPVVKILEGPFVGKTTKNGLFNSEWRPVKNGHTS
ncbi:MAG: hypothetical protein A2541_02275 [Candidatus Taylorbacteria bacterium RIFOXYD2_FULL_36_9]|uniref:Uncharacterized protein n=1 Tax=Candidatus Taylorbacteria bacterium RIFOXYD2_FULL_36_9 TaxID=1802338 RepID=A0A1G2PGM1_9BACT|nr:MAG: hypothetical protein A2541_02275 [Candidatus Taylorbacteria bacterium RIFOXYD2_FULL_36_9]